ncbi:MAG: nucleotide pyrophosphatase/phosphodiesterase family protein [Blastocatellia bacterium]
MFFRFLQKLLTKKFLILWLFFIFWSCKQADIKPAQNKIADLKPTVILISLDGFRADFLSKNTVPTLHQLASDGVRSEALIPVFPTKTFPNHYTIVTGLYPENHGVVANRMYDPKLNKYFPGSDREEIQNAAWWGGEPIWITAQLQGQISATLFWPGSETTNGRNANHWLPYDKSLSYRDRVNHLLTWLDLPLEKRPTLITLYLEEIDIIGHDNGPDSPKIKEGFSLIENTLQDLIAGLKAREIFEQVNLIVVSDHGMAALSEDRAIYLDDYIDLSKIKVVQESPLAWVWPKEDELTEVHQKLAKAHPNLKAYLKDELPEKYHYRNNPRIPPIIAIADEGYFITTHGIMKSLGRTFASGGTHGYDPDLASMQGIFIAHGPAFKKNLIVPPFRNINVYNVISSVLSLKPAPNDGCTDCFQHLLK